MTVQRIAMSGQRVQATSRRSSQGFYRHLPIYLSISPVYILFTIFGLIPVLFSLYLAFQKWDGIGVMKFVGLNQFTYLLSDPYFWQALVNTLEIWLLSTIPTQLLGLVIAFLLSASLRLKVFYQVAYLVPHVTSTVAIAIIFASIFSNHFGLANALLVALHLPRVQWLINPWDIKLVIALMIIWRGTGYSAMIYLAGLQSIPAVLYEAARIDGANAWQAFLRITIPLLRPVILFALITSTIAGLQIFTEPQVLFNGGGAANEAGPGNAGMTLVLYLYQQAFENNQFGYGAAIGWALFVLIVMFSVLNWKLVRRSGLR